MSLNLWRHVLKNNKNPRNHERVTTALPLGTAATRTRQPIDAMKKFLLRVQSSGAQGLFNNQEFYPDKLEIQRSETEAMTGTRTGPKMQVDRAGGRSLDPAAFMKEKEFDWSSPTLYAEASMIPSEILQPIQRLFLQSSAR